MRGMGGIFIWKYKRRSATTTSTICGISGVHPTVGKYAHARTSWRRITRTKVVIIRCSGSRTATSHNRRGTTVMSHGNLVIAATHSRNTRNRLANAMCIGSLNTTITNGIVTIKNFYVWYSVFVFFYNREVKLFCGILFCICSRVQFII